MSSYNELIKNFERVRSYMREFYVYGFKSRADYDNKSARSYDDEKRRMESILGDYMSFVRTPEGKIVFISIDSRTVSHNPLYKAWKSKSFTDKDITLHFIIFDILIDSTSLSVKEITERIDSDYLNDFSDPISFDESTVRKKLDEYVREGILKKEKSGRSILYSRVPDTALPDFYDALSFFSEVEPVGAVGSFLLDKYENEKPCFAFKHHYITSALDDGVMAALFDAMGKQSSVTVSNYNPKKKREANEMRVVPLLILQSAQNGRAHLLCYGEESDRFYTMRIDYLSSVKICAPCKEFESLRERVREVENFIWGVNVHPKLDLSSLETVGFTVSIERGEEYVISRLEREKRCGALTPLGGGSYRFSAEVFDSTEAVPWVRSFIGFITELSFSRKSIERDLMQSIYATAEKYGIEVKRK